MHSSSTIARWASLTAYASVFLADAVAGQFSGNKNIAVYWGQNSYGASSGSLEQQDLATYCSNTDIDIIPMAFLYQITTGEGGQPVINFANTGNDCTTFDGTELLHCPQVGADIKTCQSQGKKIILSVGGATYTEGGFSSSDAAVTAANLVWNTFGPDSNNGALRPFDDAVIDGFDMDFESTVSNVAAFAQQLRTNMDGDSSKSYYLTAAPQCPYPDAADNDMLNAVSFDAVFVQFYNNYCGLGSYVAGSTTQNNFDFNTWDNWAKTTSANKNIQVFLGVPADTTAAGSGYEPISSLTPIIQYSQTFSSFGGVMMWDASQAYANNGFISGVASAMGGSSKRDLSARTHPRQFKA